MSVKQVYSKLGHPVAFSGRTKLYQFLRDEMSYGDVKKELEDINTYTIKRQVKRKKYYNPYYVYDKRKLMQMDLIDFTVDKSIVRANKNVRYLFCVIDSLTRYLFVRPMKRKNSKEVIKTFMDIYREMGKPQRILTDRGLEWTNKNFKKLMDELQINHITTTTHPGTVERVQGTLQNLIYRYMEENKTLYFLNVLDKLVKTYNMRYHQSIKMSPKIAEKRSSLSKLRRIVHENYSKVKKKKPALAVGDHVRKRLQRGVFGRGYKDTFSKEIYIIHNINTRKPRPMYTIKDFSDNVQQERFYSHDLQRVTFLKTISFITKKKKKIRGRTYVLVRWEDGTENWIDEEQIAHINVY